MTKKKLLARLMANQKNVKYSDFVTLIEAFGFELDRTNGSHNIYYKEKIPRNLNIQDEKGQAKSYQVKQFLQLVEEYKLKLEK